MCDYDLPAGTSWAVNETELTKESIKDMAETALSLLVTHESNYRAWTTPDVVSPSSAINNSEHSTKMPAPLWLPDGTMWEPIIDVASSYNNDNVSDSESSSSPFRSSSSNSDDSTWHHHHHHHHHPDLHLAAPSDNSYDNDSEDSSERSEASLMGLSDPVWYPLIDLLAAEESDRGDMYHSASTSTLGVGLGDSYGEEEGGGRYDVGSTAWGGEWGSGSASSWSEQLVGRGRRSVDREEGRGGGGVQL